MGFSFDLSALSEAPALAREAAAIALEAVVAMVTAPAGESVPVTVAVALVSALVFAVLTVVTAPAGEAALMTALMVALAGKAVSVTVAIALVFALVIDAVVSGAASMAGEVASFRNPRIFRLAIASLFERHLERVAGAGC